MGKVRIASGCLSFHLFIHAEYPLQSCYSLLWLSCSSPSPFFFFSSCWHVCLFSHWCLRVLCIWRIWILCQCYLLKVPVPPLLSDERVLSRWAIWTSVWQNYRQIAHHYTQVPATWCQSDHSDLCSSERPEDKWPSLRSVFSLYSSAWLPASFLPPPTSSSRSIFPVVLAVNLVSWIRLRTSQRAILGPWASVFLSWESAFWTSTPHNLENHWAGILEHPLCPGFWVLCCTLSFFFSFLSKYLCTSASLHFLCQQLKPGGNGGEEAKLSLIPQKVRSH